MSTSTSSNRIDPLDLEREFGLSEGNIFPGELSLGQLFFLRPVAGVGAVPDADQEPLHLRLGGASGRRNYGRAASSAKTNDSRASMLSLNCRWLILAIRRQPSTTSRRIS
jgi:hypothetical protein